jgi:hypothetical protein
MGCPQAVSEEKALQNSYQTLNDWKTHLYISVITLPLLADLQRKVGEFFHNFLSHNQYFTKCFKLVYRKNGYGNFYHLYNVSPVHLHAIFGGGEFYEGGPRVCRPPMKWSAIAESLIWAHIEAP